MFAPGRPRDLGLIRIHGDDFDLSAMHKQVIFPATGLPFSGLDDNAGLQGIEGADQVAGFICNCPDKSRRFRIYNIKWYILCKKYLSSVKSKSQNDKDALIY